MTDKENHSHTDRKYTSIASELTNSISTDLTQVLGPALSIVTKSLEERSKLMHTSGISVLQDYIKQYDKLMQSSIISQIGKDSLSSALSSVSYLNKLASSSAEILSSSVNFKAASSAVADMVSALEELNDSECFSEDDFVTCDEESIKEWNVPDTIAIPIGHNRIRMKTDIFIAFISGIVIPVIFGIAGLVIDLGTAISESQSEAQRIELEEERNNLINESNHLFDRYLDILDSTDTSNSSESDEIERWRESLPRPDSVPVTADSTLDPNQESHNSNPE